MKVSILAISLFFFSFNSIAQDFQCKGARGAYLTLRLNQLKTSEVIALGTEVYSGIQKRVSSLELLSCAKRDKRFLRRLFVKASCIKQSLIKRGLDIKRFRSSPRFKQIDREVRRDVSFYKESSEGVTLEGSECSSNLSVLELVDQNIESIIFVKSVFIIRN